MTGGPDEAFETVTLTDAIADWLFEVSRDRAPIVCGELFGSAVVSQAILYGAVVTSEPNAAPSTKNCTPATPWLSLAVAVRSIVPPTVALLAGAVIDTVGGVVSELDTVTVTDADCVRPA